MTRALLRYLARHHWGLVATFIALGGTAYAATALPANSVGSRQIHKNAVTLLKIAPGTRRWLRAGARGTAGGVLTGKYPDPSIKKGAVTANMLAAPPAETNDQLTEKLATGLGVSWNAYNAPSFGFPSYYRDDQGVVHLDGLAQSLDNIPVPNQEQNQCENSSEASLPNIFVLPTGYRPAAREVFSVVSGNAFGRVDVLTDGEVICVYGSGDQYVSLDGISFRASGQ